MTFLAILKHINVKNADYSAAVRYLVFLHDDHARPVYDEQGEPILREKMLIDSINCGVISYDFDCRLANKQYHKNQSKNEVKSHVFIISFEPSDIERGLTVEKAQELGMEFAQKHFNGHQCIVATHADGNQGSHNIHVHISFNSLRTQEIPQPEYSDFERDRLPGYKFHPTDRCLQYLKEDLMELCRSNGLGQVELNKPAGRKVTDREYWAQKRGEHQAKSASHSSDDIDTPNTPTPFQTDLEQLRQAISAALQQSDSEQQFREILMKQYDILIKESRGRWSYLPKCRQRAISWRRLGNDYQKEIILKLISTKTEKKTPVFSATTAKSFPTVPSHRIIDLNDPKIASSYGLTQWAKLQNLKEASRTFNFLCENHLDLDALDDTISLQKQHLRDCTDQLRSLEHQHKDTAKLLKMVEQFYENRTIYTEYRRQGKSQTFRDEHITPILLYEAAQRHLNEWSRTHNGQAVPGRTPLNKSLKNLDAQIAEIKKKRMQQKNTLKTLEEGQMLFSDRVQQKFHQRSSHQAELI